MPAKAGLSAYKICNGLGDCHFRIRDTYPFAKMESASHLYMKHLGNGSWGADKALWYLLDIGRHGWGRCFGEDNFLKAQTL